MSLHQQLKHPDLAGLSRAEWRRQYRVKWRAAHPDYMRDYYAHYSAAYGGRSMLNPVPLRFVVRNALNDEAAVTLNVPADRRPVQYRCAAISLARRIHQSPVL